MPDTEQMRNYAPMLILQARVAIAEGDFARAVHHLETGFAFSRQVADGPFLVNTLVAIALAARFTDVATDLIEQPGARTSTGRSRPCLAHSSTCGGSRTWNFGLSNP